jgi:hypothetical protein
MEVIPLTLGLSLVLSLTFIALFVREFSRPRRAGADRDSLLPLEADSAAPRPAGPPASGAAHRHGHGQGHSHEHGDEVCASKRGDGKCCSSCQRRKDRAAAKAAPVAAHGTSST